MAETLAHIADPHRREPFDWTYKGLAPAWEGMTADQIAVTAFNLFDGRVSMPTAILKRSALDGNRAWMRGFLALTGAWLAPHGKTTLAPELFRLQAEDGAWAMTAATPHHVRLYRKFGVSRILLANQLIGEADIDWVIAEQLRDPGFEFFCLVDSVASVDQLADRVRRDVEAKPIKVLIEVGRPGGRCGVRDVAEGLQVAWAAAACSPYVTLVGFETFEGVSQLSHDAADIALGMLDTTVDLAKACLADGLVRAEPVLLSAGGSSLFDLAARVLNRSGLAAKSQTILRSGCYISHDDGAYSRLFAALLQRTPEAADLGVLKGALQVWARVQSLPEPGQAVCALGRRDVGDETDKPRPIAWLPSGATTPRSSPDDLRVTTLFDQHAVLQGAGVDALKVGDLIGFGVSHPCTTFDKWRTLLIVDDAYAIVDVIRTYF